MKYMIASDLHGSAFYCERLLAAMEKESAQGLILLGDILYHGPRNDLPKGYGPKQVIAMLNPLKEQIICVRGNCDAEVDQMVLDFPIMDTYRVVELCGHRLFLTHGHHYSIEAAPGEELLQGAGFVLYGHTHVPLNQEKDGLVFLNPGSVSIPKGGSYHGYMTLTDRGFQWKNFQGTIVDERLFGTDIP